MFNFFGSNPNPNNPAPNANPNPNNPNPAPGNPNPNPNIDPNNPNPNPNDPNNTKPEPQGLDKFLALVQTQQKPGDPNNPQVKQPLNITELFSNPEFTKTLQENMRGQFKVSISQETQDKIAANDPTALMDLVQDAMTSAYMTSMQHSAHLQNLAMTDQLDAFGNKVDQNTQQAISQHSLVQQIPQLKNPVVQLGVESVIQRMREQNPTATPEDLQKQITEYITELGKAFGAIPTEDPNNPSVAADGLPQDFNWLNELGLELPPEAPGNPPAGQT